MSQPPSWDPYGQQDPGQYQGQPPFHGQPEYQGQPHPGQPPYQGQPYGPSPGQQPYPGPGYGNGYGPQPPRRTKRHRVRRAIIGAAVAIVGIIVIASIASAGKGGHTVTTGQAATPTSSASKAARHPAKIGSVIVLTGNSAGEKMAVTVVKVFRHPQPADQFFAPQQGDRLYAVQFRFNDIGSVAYSDSPSNGAAVVDAAGQS